MASAAKQVRAPMFVQIRIPLLNVHADFAFLIEPGKEQSMLKQIRKTMLDLPGVGQPESACPEAAPGMIGQPSLFGQHNFSDCSAETMRGREDKPEQAPNLRRKSSLERAHGAPCDGAPRADRDRGPGSSQPVPVRRRSSLERAHSASCDGASVETPAPRLREARTHSASSHSSRQAHQVQELPPVVEPEAEHKQASTATRTFSWAVSRVRLAMSRAKSCSRATNFTPVGPVSAP
mmetsp:Transcript_62793/g.161618  ORF Transcript_62793/g.161618 Transcript_62793/m.161618 type:complete len:235 (+) Transcript_62793:72-776(+)